MAKRDIEKEIRECWFKNHQAQLVQHGDLQVLSWREPGTGTYAIRYVFDGSRIYISGDVGEAIYWLTWRAHIHSFNDLSMGYFTEKLAVFCEERWDFSSEKAVKGLREWVKRLKEYEKQYDHDDMKQLFDAARSCSSESEWAYHVNELNDFISELDCDYWEWMYKVGRDYPSRLRSYLIGLQMASEQLKKFEAQQNEQS